METTSTTPPTEVARSGRTLHGFALGSVMTALLLTLLLEALDQTVVTTALPRIIGSLQGFDKYTWVVTAYTLASCTLIPIVGKLSDQFGRKWFLVGGTAIFIIGSILSGAAQTMDQLIIFRGVQGVGAGVGIALVFTVIGDIFPPAERPKWQSLFGVVYGFSSVAGPSIGGWFTDHGPLIGNFITEETRWRWVFYINLPVGFIALAAMLLYLPTNVSARSNTLTGWAAVRRIDALGALLSAIATISLLLGLSWGGNQTYAWNSPQVIMSLVAAVVLYALFIVRERLAIEPILPLDLFRNQVFAASAMLSLLQFMILVGLILYIPLYLQGVLGVSASSAGAAITPLTFSSVIGAASAGGIIIFLKRYQAVMIIGTLILTVGVYLLTHLTTTTSVSTAIVFMIIAGFGMGTFFSILQLAAQNALPVTRLGVGTSAVRYVGQIGAVLAVAIVGSVVNNSLSSDLKPRLSAIPGIESIPSAVVTQATNPEVLVNGDYRQALIQGVVQHTPVAYQQSAITTMNAIFDALKASLSTAIVQGLFVVLGLSIATIIVAFLLKDIPMRTTNDPTETPAS